MRGYTVVKNFLKYMSADRPVFQFLNCWDHNIYLALFLSIVAIGCVYGLIKRSFNAMLESMWSYTSVLLSDYFAIKVKNLKPRFLAIIWLLVNTLLLSLYAGFLYDFIIRGQIVDKIEKKEELVSKPNWMNTTIYSIDDATGDYFYWGLTQSDGIALQLFERHELLDLLEVYFNANKRKAIFEEVLRNKAVITGNKLNTFLQLRKVQMEWPIFMANYIEGLDFFISKPETDPKCYYLGWNKDVFNQMVLDILNEVYDKFIYAKNRLRVS